MWLFLWLDSVARNFVVRLFAFPAVGKFSQSEFRRRPTALAKKISKPDRVGRRGLFEPREDFPRLLTYAIPWPFRWLDRNTLH